jgi:hypothetical protein
MIRETIDQAARTSSAGTSPSGNLPSSWSLRVKAMGQRLQAGSLEANDTSFRFLVDPYGEPAELLGLWGNTRRPVWESQLPRGFRFSVTPSSGVFTARMPMSPDRPTASVYGLLLSPVGVDMGGGSPTTLGGGFGFSGGFSIPVEIAPR